MAIYSIRTTRAQEIGLNFIYDNYVDKVQYPTKEAFLQYQIDLLVLNPMYARQQQQQLMSFDQSFNTVPETEQPAARTEIEGVITTHGGTIIPAGPPPAPNPTGGDVPAPRGSEGNPIQVGGRTKKDVPASGRDVDGDKST